MSERPRDAKITHFNMGVYVAQCKKCTFCFIAKKICNELKLENLVQDNIAILKHCDVIKVIAIGVLQEAMTQICRWGWLHVFPM